MKFTKIRQCGREYSVAFPNEEAVQFGDVVQNATITSAGVAALSTDSVVWNVATGQFLLRRGLTYYDAWSASTDETVGDAASWAAKLTAGRCFYINNGDGTMKWFYYDGVQMLESVAEADTSAAAFVADLGNFSSVSAGLSAAGAKDLASNLAVRLITFSVPSLNESVNILQQHFGSICTQMVLAEGKTRTSYLRSVVLGGNYSVGNLQQLHLYTKMRVENGMLVGYTADGVDSPNCKRTEICSLTEAAATASTDETETTE